MPSGLHLKWLVGVVLVALTAVLMFQGKSIPFNDIYNAFSYVVSAVAVVLVFWERYLWHWWPFYPHFHTKPNLRGTWKGELVSDFPDRHGEVIEVYLVVRQTFSTIDIRLFSAESSSVSLSAHFVSDNIGFYTLASTYRNTPTVLRRQRSPINHGGLLLSIRGAPVHQLDGEYWTDRGTKGEIVFRSRSNCYADDFSHAQRLVKGQISKHDRG